jgi:putative phosphoribosyl transferase
MVSKKISSDFEILLPRKLTDPDNKEQAIGAIMEDGSIHLIEELFDHLQITKSYLNKEIEIQMNEIKRRAALYRPPQYTIDNVCNKILKYKTIILADDGISTGSTILTTAKWIRKMMIQKNQQTDIKHLIVATPIIPKNVIKILKQECNAEVEAIFIPSSSSFKSVEQYHQNFGPITDQDVIKILQKRNFL